MWYAARMKHTASKSSKRAPKDFVLGRAHFAKISAVEGIHLTPEMEADFREFDRLGLSSEERRKAILRKYGRVR
jgi:hypothetical protein